MNVKIPHHIVDYCEVFHLNRFHAIIFFITKSLYETTLFCEHYDSPNIPSILFVKIKPQKLHKVETVQYLLQSNEGITMNTAIL